MKRQYFNTMLINKIMNIKESNPKLAIKLFEEYLKEYKHDYYGYLFYIDELIAVGKINEAEDVFNMLNAMILNNNNFGNIYGDSIKNFYKHFNGIKIRLLFLQERYKELLLFFNSCDEERIDEEMYLIKLTALKQLGKDNWKNKEKYSYLFKQAIDYSEEEFKEHIKKHFANYNDSGEICSCFNSDFPIDDILIEVKKNIPSDKVFYFHNASDVYYFKYDNCGRYNRKVQNFFKVACFHGTNKIITMYPVDFGEDTDYVDLNYMNYNNEYYNNEKKETDRIAKFYKRYNKRKS